MSAKRNRFIAVLIALVMVLTSAASVFAVESIQQGEKVKFKTVGKVGKGTIKVTTVDKNVKYKVVGKHKKWKTTSGKTIKKLKEGCLVIIKASDGKAYRWMKTVDIKKVTKKKITWGKVKYANKGYQIEVTTKKGKVITKKVSKGTTSVKASKFKLKSFKGCKVRVRPLRKKNGKVYSGVLCDHVQI